MAAMAVTLIWPLFFGIWEPPNVYVFKSLTILWFIRKRFNTPSFWGYLYIYVFFLLFCNFYQTELIIYLVFSNCKLFFFINNNTLRLGFLNCISDWLDLIWHFIFLFNDLFTMLVYEREKKHNLKGNLTFTLTTTVNENSFLYKK